MKAAGSSEQKAALRRLKVDLNMENERYLRSQPDVHKLLKALVTSILDEKPENVGGFAYRFFSQDAGTLD
uniref:AlNc14C252G9666 protein n=1 Tax=Albugo laibachii Nc14 TaxID=890382 RepID=F0WTI7_9STRA|nr:AlNc14C252G9666 [Albugo laibachii Nc14]|eukprot:CCA24678.1 AlNc14C252G9666 [Albugo laibachii Nc14]